MDSLIKPPMSLPAEESFGAVLARRMPVYILMGVIVGWAIAVFNPLPSLSRALALGTTEQPQPVTELYFNNYEHLPSQLAPGKLASFSFHIANHMARTVSYNYEVVDQTAAGSKLIRSGTVTLQNSHGTNVVVSFKLATPNQDNEIAVMLQNPPQHIDFWVQAP